MFFMITGTREMGLKLLGSDGLPDLKMGWTIECFPELGMSERMIEMFMMCKIISQIVWKHVFNIRMHMPSVPRAGRGRVSHAEHCVLEFPESDGSRLKTACADTGEAYI